MRKPKHLHALHGTKPSYDPERSISAPIRQLTAPVWLPEEQVETFDAFAKELHDTQVTSQLDQTALALLCDALARFLKIKAQLDSEPMILSGRQDTNIKNPLFTVLKEERAALIAMLKSCAMTPASRTAIAPVLKAEVKDVADDIMDFMDF